MRVTPLQTQLLRLLEDEGPQTFRCLLRLTESSTAWRGAENQRAASLQGLLRRMLRNGLLRSETGRPRRYAARQLRLL